MLSKGFCHCEESGKVPDKASDKLLSATEKIFSLKGHLELQHMRTQGLVLTVF